MTPLRSVLLLGLRRTAGMTRFRERRLVIDSIETAHHSRLLAGRLPLALHVNGRDVGRRLRVGGGSAGLLAMADEIFKILYRAHAHCVGEAESPLVCVSKEIMGIAVGEVVE